MEPIQTAPFIPPVDAFDISSRGRIADSSGWHAAEKRVNTLALRCSDDSPPPHPVWPWLLQQLGADLALANRRAAELRPTIEAVNRVIEALNTLPADANFADLERAVGLREPRTSLDRIGDAMTRVLRSLEARRTDANRTGSR
ncbi:MAG TPA: hypothetical protein DCM32_07835 [Xanthomonadaceae bacterium]|jgi:hypothetical protein|nr:hypothetical protein [Xanthomonadaceae bacterium]